MKLLRSFFVVPLIIVTVSACTSEDAKPEPVPTLDEQSETVAPAPVIPIFQGEGLLSESFDSFDELVSASQDDGSLIIVGSVDSSESLLDDTRTPYTISQIVVSEIIFGDVPEGRVVSVYELGGIAYGFRKDDPTFIGSPVEVAYGTQVMRKGERWLLFLQPYDSALLKDGYRVVGAFQGKFRVDSDDVIRFVGEQEDKDGIEHAAQSEVDSMPLNDVISRIEARLRG